jgi:dethiobiotin synthetase
MTRIFVSGIGTGIGKTVVSAIVADALEADYWKPVQAGLSLTDSEWINKYRFHKNCAVHKELYRLKLAASPHIAARVEGINITIKEICEHSEQISGDLIIEGPGGLLVPLNDNEFVIDLIKTIGAKLLLVSRNYLGSINHSLLTARICKSEKIDVLGWVFNDQYLDYEQEIVEWSGFPRVYSVPHADNIDTDFLKTQAEKLKHRLLPLL